MDTPERVAREIDQKREGEGISTDEPKRLVFELPEWTPDQLDAQRRRWNEARRSDEKPRFICHNSITVARGARYQRCRLSNYEIYHDDQKPVKDALIAFCRGIDQNVRDGRNIILFGPKGTGKDHLITAVGLHADKAGHSVRWENGMDLYGSFRDAMDADTTEKELIRALVRPDVLIISDPIPPKGSLTEYQTSMLFRVIDGRYSELKGTWVTLNCLSGGEAEERMGAQTVDRLKHDALSLWCEWPSFRER